MRLAGFLLLIFPAILAGRPASDLGPLPTAPGESCSMPMLAGNDSAPATPQDPRDLIFYPSDTETLKPLGKKLIHNIILDQKDIWTSPFHINRQNAGWWALTAGATGFLIAYDRTISNGLENSSGQIRYGNRISRLGATYTIIPAAAGFYLAGVITDNAKARETGVLGTEAMLDALIVSSVVKTATSRRRPNASRPGKFFDGGNSFPSGHAISTWALASVVAHEYASSRWIPVTSYGLATLVSGARFAARQHFASDLVAGAVAGWFIGRYVYNTHEEHRSHASKLVSHLAPQIIPSTRTYAVSFDLSSR